jgi:hypothetical protein
MQVGPHQVEIELPDIMHIHLNGDVEVEHFRGFYDLIVAFPPPTIIYVLRDARRGGAVSMQARKYIARNANMDQVAAIVNYGSSFHTRTVLSMMSRAFRLINNRMPPAIFFETEVEARAWISVHRNAARKTSLEA